MMLSMFNLSVSAIGPESSARPEPHTEHLITRMTVDPPGFLRLRVARHSGSRSRLQRTRYLAMAARITAHSTPFRLLLFSSLSHPSAVFPSPLSQPRRELARPLLDYSSMRTSRDSFLFLPSRTTRYALLFGVANSCQCNEMIVRGQ